MNDSVLPSSMNSEQDIYQAILREPEREDLLRQYASLLALRGDPQAELIEAQIALESTSEDAEQYPEWQRREAEVLERFGREMAGADSTRKEDFLEMFPVSMFRVPTALSMEKTSPGSMENGIRGAFNVGFCEEQRWMCAFFSKMRRRYSRLIP